MNQAPLKPIDSQRTLIVEGDASQSALTPIHPHEAPINNTPMSLRPVAEMQAMHAEYTLRRKAWRSLILGGMTKGIHYGVPPGCEAKTDREGRLIDFKGGVIGPDQWRIKASLYKAGAQYLCDFLMMRPVFTTLIEEQKHASTADRCVFVFKCELINEGGPIFNGRPHGCILGEGRGARAVGDKKGNENNAIKMAQKAALVDAVITVLGIADLFDQKHDGDEHDFPPPNPQPEKDASQPQAPTRAEAAAKPKSVPSPGQALWAEWSAANDHKKSTADFSAWVKSKLPSIGRKTEPTKENPLTADDCAKLSVLIEEEFGL